MDLSIDYDFYIEEFKGVSISLLEFEAIYGRCFDMIELLAKEFNASISTSKDVDCFKKAVALQVEYIYTCGGFESVYMGGITSATIGDFKYSSEGDSKRMYSPIAFEFIKNISVKAGGCDLYV